MDRRTFLQTSAALATSTSALFASGTRTRVSQKANTKLILLGTAGGPRPRLARSAPAQVIVANGAAYVVDCGNAVARQLVAAGVPLNSIRTVLITHHHSDHNADYGTLLLLAWTGGLQKPVDTWGPPPLARMTDLFFEMSATDIETRMLDEARVPLRPLIRAHDIRTAGLLFQDENVKVTAAVVHHPPATPAFAYRFDAADRSIVISGDTTKTDALIELAKDADVLVHEAIIPSAVDRLIANVPNAPDLKRSILSHHTSAEEAGQVAQAARVKTLVLSHLIPAEDPLVTDSVWVDAARKSFAGRIVVGRDLMEV
ncbi:MAG: MBL fold metallo-hydrolase [Phycisphaerae bacterium]|nr:MBL fold metallo-hydrolase [Gemmatimonadaceae bacterium]